MMASTHCNTSALPVGVLSNAVRALRAYATWSIRCSASLPSPIPWRRHPNGSTTVRGEEGTTGAREAGATGVEGRRATTQATSLAPQGGTSLENVARVETRGMSQADATAAGQQAGGAPMTTSTVTAATWWVGVDRGIPEDMRAWMLPFRSSP